MATLVVIDGPVEGQKFALEQHHLVMIGRDHGATFQVLDGHISRNHMQVKRVSGSNTHVAIDFGSANGVFINDKIITEDTPLRDGDVIRIGSSGILYSEQDEPDAMTISQLLRKHGQGYEQTRVDEPQKPA